MKKKYGLKLINLSLVAVAMTFGSALAGTEVAAATQAPVAEDVISASLSLSGNSHFICYGKDVWGDGSSMSSLEFNPMLEFAFKLPENFTLTLGTWWDVTAKGDQIPGYPGLGADIYEIDLWSGFSYTYDKFTIGATYQAWCYGDDVENIVDIKLAYDCFLSPSLVFHNRVSEGASGGDTGTVAVLGLSHTIEAGPLSISFPVNFAANLTEDYNRYNVNGGSSAGYAYTSAGTQFSYPLAFLGDTYGKWNLNAGIVQYWTSGAVIPVNPINHFLTYNFGLSAAF